MKSPNAITSRLPAGTVVTSVDVGVPPARVFAAVTEPALAARWLGELTAPLRTGVPARVEFGDGDFFSLEDVVIEPPRSISFRWRFLGIMPADFIHWNVEPNGSGSRVTITDTDPLREDAWLEELRDGWRDFTGRLVQFLVSGETTRYDWRRSVDGGIELPCRMPDARRLLDEPALSWKWLRAEGGLVEGARLTLDDGLEPAVVTLRGLSRDAEEVQFHIGAPAWRTPTACSLALRPRGAGVMLNVSHGGWEDISPSDDTQRTQRRRFAEFWIAALTRAHSLFGARGELP